MLSRGNGRDLFDVYQITGLEIDADIFRKCVVIESLMGVNRKLYEMDTDSIINSIPIDDRLMNLLRKRKIPPDINSKVATFAVKNIQQLSLNEKELINNFYDKKTFTPELIGKEVFHPCIGEHPGIKWALQNLSKKI